MPVLLIMTRRRFYAPPTAFANKQDSVTLIADEARHLREVLRLKAGDEVFVFDGAGKEFHCRIAESRRDTTQLEVLAEVSPAKPESPLQLTLALALLKGEKFDLVVQKATELGVTRIVPVITKHADIRLRDKSDAAKRVTRWQRIAMEAAKQSGRAVVPVVDSVSTFGSLVETASEAEHCNCVMFSEREGQSLLQTKGRLADTKQVTALVGSEGGWSDEEIDGARAAGWSVVTLGGRTLRAETAAIAVVALLQHIFGDLI